MFTSSQAVNKSHCNFVDTNMYRIKATVLSVHKDKSFLLGENFYVCKIPVSKLQYLYYCISVWHCSHFKCIIKISCPLRLVIYADSLKSSLVFIFDFLVLHLCSHLVICCFECPRYLYLLPVAPPWAALFLMSPVVFALGQVIELGVSEPAFPDHHSGQLNWSH